MLLQEKLSSAKPPTIHLTSGGGEKAVREWRLLRDVISCQHSTSSFYIEKVADLSTDLALTIFHKPQFYGRNGLA